MMTGRLVYLRVGLLLSLGLAAIVGIVLFLSGSQTSNGWKFESYFKESVQGLDVGAPVKFRGVTLGQVTEIALATASYPLNLPADVQRSQYQLVVVRLTLDPKKMGSVSKRDVLVATGLRARVASQGITGLSYIELDIVDPDRYPVTDVPWTPRDEVIPSMPSTIARVQDAAQELMTKLQTVDLTALSGSLQMVLDDVHTQLTTGDIHATAHEAQQLLHELRSTVDTANLPAVMADLKATSTALRGMVEGKPTRDMVAAFTKAADRLSDASARLQPLIVSMQAAVRRADDGVGDLQHELVPMLRDAKAAAANLRETSETLRRNPSSLLLGAPPPREPGR